MLALDDYQKLLRQVAELEKERERSIGILNEMKKEMKKKWGCKTLKQLKEKLKEMKEKEQRAADLYFSTKKKFLKKYRHLLEKDDAVD